VNRRKAQQLGKALADEFNADDQQDRRAAGPGLTPEQLKDLLDNCLKLAAENKITDKNVWALPLISHLPEIVHAAARTEGFNFQKMSSGLDAGVQIYSKRVEQTWKAARDSLFGTGNTSGTTHLVQH
jgi:condensin complex subunit 2